VTARKARRPSLTARLAAHVALATFALQSVIATEPDAGLEDPAERKRQRAARAPKREAMIPAVARLVEDGLALAAEQQQRAGGSAS